MTQSASSHQRFNQATRWNLNFKSVLELARAETVNGWLIVTVLFTLLPCFVIAYIAKMQYSRADRLELVARVESQADAVRNAVEREIDHMQELGLHLARIEPLLRAEPDKLNSIFVASLAQDRNHDVHMLLADATGRQIMNTRAVAGAALPQVSDMAGLELAVKERRPVIRLISRGSVSHQPLYMVIVPILGHARVERLIFVNRSSSHLLSVADDQLPTGWHATIFDAHGRPFESSEPLRPMPMLPEHLGLSKTPKVVESSGRQMTAYTTIDRAGWTIAVTAAGQDFWSLRIPLLVSVPASVILLSLIIAWWAAQRITEPIALVERFASEIGQDTNARLPDIRIGEIRRVAETLQRTSSAVRQGRERHSALISSATDAIICIDEDKRVSLFNTAAEKMFGRHSAAALGDPIQQFLDLNAAFDAAGTRSTFECVGYRASGQEFVAEVSIARSADDRQFQYTFIIRDITLQRQVAQQNSRLAVVVASSSEAIVSMGVDHTVQSWNPSAERIFGYSAEEIVGKSYVAIIPEALRDLYLRNCDRLRSGETICITTERRHKSGRLIQVEISSSPLRDDRGEITGICSVLRDVTEKHLAATVASRLAAIVDASPDAIVSLAPDGTISTWNPAAQRLFGYAVDEIVGKSLDVLLPPDDPDKLHDKLERLRRDGLATVQTERIRKDGSRIAVSISAAPLRDANKEVAGFAVVYRDVTESHRYEQQMRIVMRELSHRAKNLLTVISAMARNMGNSTTDIAEFVEKFSARIHGLARSHDLLIKKDWSSASLASLIEAQLRPFVSSNTERLHLDGDDIALTPPAAQMIGLALHELATNAVKHGALTTSAGSVSVKWRIERSDSEASHLALTWSEMNGPAVVEPSESGIGREVLEEMIPESLDGSTELTFSETGVVWRLRIPLSRCLPVTLENR